MNDIHKVMKHIKTFGKILAAISIIFVAYSLYEIDFDWNYFDNPRQTFLFVFLLSFLAVINNYINAYAWKKYVDFFAGVKNDTFTVIDVYLKANIEKYLPGNVIQYAGRNLLGKSRGISQKSIAVASVMELLWISISAIIFSFMISLQNTKSVINQLWTSPEIKRNIIVLSVFAILILPIIIIFCIKTKYLNILWPYLNRKFFILNIITFGLYAMNYMIAGLLLSLIFILILRCKVNYVNITSTNVLAWLAGYVVPGSPGGIGVREAVLILLLGTEYSKDIVALAAILLRICGIIGDFLSYLMTISLEFFRNKGKLKDDSKIIE